MNMAFGKSGALQEEKASRAKRKWKPSDMRDEAIHDEQFNWSPIETKESKNIP